MYNTNQAQAQMPAYYQMNRPVYPGYSVAGLKGRPVASIEEARASIIDFDGSIFYFPDLANQRIYTKQINMDGTAVLSMYELKEIPVNAPETSSTQYVTREEFESAMQLLKDSLVVESEPQQVSRPKEPAVQLNF